MIAGTAREFAAEVVNMTDFNEDIPHGAVLRLCLDWGFEFDECGDCGRVDGQHAASCRTAPKCECCGNWPCTGDDYEIGEIA